VGQGNSEEMTHHPLFAGRQPARGYKMTKFILNYLIKLKRELLLLQNGCLCCLVTILTRNVLSNFRKEAFLRQKKLFLIYLPIYDFFFVFICIGLLARDTLNFLQTPQEQLSRIVLSAHGLRHARDCGGVS